MGKKHRFIEFVITDKKHRSIEFVNMDKTHRFIEFVIMDKKYRFIIEFFLLWLKSTVTALYTPRKNMEE
jgi:hypothetical protein